MLWLLGSLYQEWFYEYYIFFCFFFGELVLFIGGIIDFQGGNYVYFSNSWDNMKGNLVLFIGGIYNQGGVIMFILVIVGMKISWVVKVILKLVFVCRGDGSLFYYFWRIRMCIL